MNFPILKNNQANLGKKHTSPQLFYESNESERFYTVHSYIYDSEKESDRYIFNYNKNTIRMKV